MSLQDVISSYTKVWTVQLAQKTLKNKNNNYFNC